MDRRVGGLGQMKEQGLRGQDVLTLLRLYVGAAGDKQDRAIQTNVILEPWAQSGTQKYQPTLNQKALSQELGISPAEMSGVVLRCKNLGLLNPDFTVQLQPFFRLLENGLRYFLPALSGKDCLGVPTSWGNPSVAKILRGPAGRTPVWAADTGEVHGPAVTPLFRSVPYIVSHHSKLYAALAAVDLLRLGGARETEVGLEVLRGLKA
jgi:hypothetical protein